MRSGRHSTITVAQREEFWRRYKAGESVLGIIGALGQRSANINRVLEASGGIAPVRRTRSARVLRFTEREEISRGLAAEDSLRVIAKRLNRAVSTVSQDLLHLIKMWLIAPVEEDDGRGGKRRTTPCKDSGRGGPQGSPLSPLLGNLYMRRFVLGWKQRGVESRLQARIVSYADDYVICCKGDVDEALAQMRQMMRRLKLTVNEAKTRVCYLPQERFDFLGYTFGRYYSPQTGQAYLCPWPSKRSVQRLIGAIRETTERRTSWREADEVVRTINRKLLGWANYFSLGPTGKAYRTINQYTPRRLCWWLCRKHKVRNSGASRFPYEYLYDTLGLVELIAVRT